MNSKPRLNVPRFFSALLAPPLLTILCASAGQEDGAAWCMFISSAVSGVACGVMLGRHFGKENINRILLSIAFSLIFIVVCVAMSFVSCGAGLSMSNSR